MEQNPGSCRWCSQQNPWLDMLDPFIFNSNIFGTQQSNACINGGWVGCTTSPRATSSTSWALPGVLTPTPPWADYSRVSPHLQGIFFFLMSHLNLPWWNWRPFPPVLSLGTQEKSLTPAHSTFLPGLTEVPPPLQKTTGIALISNS